VQTRTSPAADSNGGSRARAYFVHFPSRAENAAKRRRRETQAEPNTDVTRLEAHRSETIADFENCRALLHACEQLCRSASGEPGLGMDPVSLHQLLSTTSDLRGRLEGVSRRLRSLVEGADTTRSASAERLRDLVEETDRLLARVDLVGVNHSSSLKDVAEIAARMVRPLLARTQHEVELRMDARDALPVAFPKREIVQRIANLVLLASQHARPSTTIVIRGRIDGGTIVVIDVATPDGASGSCEARVTIVANPQRLKTRARR